MFVEGATQEVGQFIATNPLYFAATDALAVGLVVGILAMSSGTAVFVMTVLGRIDWSDPWLAVCRTTVAFVPMAIGAALGDLLPG